MRKTKQNRVRRGSAFLNRYTLLRNIIYYQNFEEKTPILKNNRNLFEKEIFVGPSDKEFNYIEIRDFAKIPITLPEYSSDDEEEDTFDLDDEQISVPSDPRIKISFITFFDLQ